ncbi:AcrR family transcriptional regulator [Breznakia sp. PF5-3]|uniref:TetR/AcrR family transcriptional regulator n=1 Tax=unclassified Breznakia TaxID=2623764 RepID=UPI00240568DC|nr:MULTISPECIES: TetR/AcrR family transcriptional regulator [unclassified Breznakia]MDF9824880.1 AcrR family transcriptional regulator [Breznakia sp. PM6-1]MDF9835621.1 AcrR family transcriptional regulator [Breznakia sp. PF5-3]MDL2276222.1 TetR/AcrR family transcriptional regulator [Breznakia sp. OttesenSCG-928-G09]
MRVVKHHDERKNEILDTAEKLFITKGYEKTTINDILKAIGIAKGTFYHYFISKEEVLDAVIMRIIEQDMIVAKKIANRKDIRPFDKMLQILLSQSSSSTEGKSDMIDQFQQPQNVLMKQRAMEQSMHYLGPILAEVIEEGKQQQEFNTAYPLESIQFLMVGIQTLLDSPMRNKEDMEKLFQSFIDIIFRVLGVNEKIIRKEEVTNQIKQIFIN